MNTILNFIILCDKAFLEESTKKLNIMGTFDTIGAPGFPASHSFMSVVIGIEVERGQHIETLKIKKDDENSVIFQIEVPFEKTESGKHQFIHNLKDITFPKEGNYNFEVFIDNSYLGSTRLYLKKI